jgi:hypothetical protein
MLKNVVPEPVSQRSSQHKWKTIRRTDYPVGTAHRGRRWARKKGLQTRDELTDAALDCPPLFWRLLNKLSKHETAPPPIQIDELEDTFEERMNPVDPIMHGFDTDLLDAQQREAEAIPASTEPASGFEAMNAPLTTQDVDKGKAYLKDHGADSTPGWDGISQRMILGMDSEELRDLGNECIRRRSFPSVFLLSLLIGIGKRGRDLKDPSNYRAVALESCLLKFFMLLIHMRFTSACEEAGLIPPTQNGFRSEHRTNNNVFILRTMIEKCRADDERLFVAFVDITNAFPSTDHAILWLTLRDAKLTGRYFDWIRELYRQMRYKVALNGHLSEEFQSLCGVLIGDPLSPLLWNLFLSTMDLPPHPDDVMIMGKILCHLEHADDIVLASRSPAGLQKHLNDLLDLCTAHRLLVNAIKTKVMIFNGYPEPWPTFYLGDKRLAVQPEYTYIGMHMQSGTPNIFEHHYELKKRAADSSSRYLASTERLCGRGHLSPVVAKMLYTALVDCHLTHGCEVIIDTKDSPTGPLGKLVMTQRKVARHILHVKRRSAVDPLYTELGIWPISERRLLLALGYLDYLLGAEDSLLAKRAVFESYELWTRIRAPCWIGDLNQRVIRYTERSRLPLPHEWDRHTLSELKSEIKRKMIRGMEGRISSNPLLYLIHNRKEPMKEEFPKKVALKLRHYLTQVRVTSHRRAITKLLFGEDQYALHAVHHIPREERLCRMCHVAIESPHHVLMQCTADILTCALRDTFFGILSSWFQLVVPSPPVLRDEASALVFLKTVIFHWEAIPWTAQFVFRVHSHWCGNGWKVPVVIIDGLVDVPDTDEGELSSEEEDCSSESEEGE